MESKGRHLTISNSLGSKFNTWGSLATGTPRLIRERTKKSNSFQRSRVGVQVKVPVGRT